MSVIIENEIEFDFGFDIEYLVEELVSATLKNAVLLNALDNIKTEISVVISDNFGIRFFNREFRGIDKDTDVLSFPVLEFERPGDFSKIDFNDCKYFNQDTGDFILGDMIISSDKVVSQSMEYGHSIKREFSFLVVHSILHLIGYDHENERDEKIMREKQTMILDSLGITR